MPVHAFAFTPIPQRMAAASGHKWEDFWQQLAPAYHAFDKTGRPPKITLKENKYRVTAW